MTANSTEARAAVVRTDGVRDPGPRPLALVLLLRLVGGVDDPAVTAWLRSAVVRWLKSDSDLTLTEALHLGDSARRVRLAVRDSWIAEAAKLTGGASPWTQAVVLEREVAHYLTFKWPAWRRLDDPPAGASPIEHCLHIARLADELPRSTASLYRILTSQVGGTPK
jgi:hypothetical protein